MLRLRVRFSRGTEIKFISHLDIVRLWERAMHRADVSLAYTEGFSPHPRISLAAPLPIEVTSETELMDITCNETVSPHFFMDTISPQLPTGIRIMQIYPVAPEMPSLQSQVRFIEYNVEIETKKKRKTVERSLADMLNAEHFLWQHQRNKSMRRYDMRPLIDSLWLNGWENNCCSLGMRLRSDNNGSGRPEQVTSALGFSKYPRSIHRVKLIQETK